MTIDVSLYRSFGRIQRLTLFAVAFSAEELKHRSLTTFVAQRLNVGRKGAGVICDDFLGRGILREWRGYGGDRGFQMAGKLTHETLVELVKEADEQHWWPTDGELRSLWSHDYHGGEWDRCGLHVERVIGELLRMLVDGSDAHLTPKMLKAIRISNGAVLRAAAYKYWSLTDETPTLTSEFGAAFKGGLLQCWLNLAFVSGKDVRPILSDLCARMRDGLTLPKAFSEVYAALCVWTGYGEGIAQDLRGREDRFAEGCRLVLDGKFAEADKILRKIWDERKSDEPDADNLPVRLLLLTVCLAVKPAKTRPVQLMRGAGCDPSYYWERPDAVRRYYEVVSTVNKAWVNNWPDIIGGKGKLIRSAGCNENSPLTGHLLLAWDWHFLASGRTAVKERATQFFALTRDFFDAGYVNVSGLMLSLMAGAYESAEVKDMIDAVDSAGVWFLPRTEPEPEWRNLVGLLGKFLDKREKKEAREKRDENTRGSIVWSVKLEKDYNDTGFYGIEDVEPYLRPVGGDLDGSEDFELDFDDLDKKKYRSLLSEKDILFAKTLMAEDDRYGHYYSNEPLSQETMELLCGLKNLVVSVFKKSSNRYYAERVGSKPISFVKRPCQLSVTTQEDGGIALQVPSWVRNCNGEYVIRKLNDSEYAYVPIDNDVRQLAETFGDFGVGGKVVLPGVAMKEAGPVLERLTQVIPIAEPSADAADALRRVKAETTLVVRLDFAEGVLTVRAVMLPVAGNAQMTLEPGYGPAEKVIAGTLGSYVLVRDLAAETAALGRVRTALAEAEDWFDGRNVWTIDDIGAAIVALGALKALEPPVTLEWFKDRRLNVQNVPTSGVTLESFRTADEWFSVKGTFKLDDGRVLSVVQLLEAMRGRRGNYVRLSDGDYLTLTKSMASELDALAAVSRRKGDGVEVTRAAIPMLDGVFGRDKDSLALPEAMAKSAEEIRAVFAKRPQVPTTLTAELRPYQV